MARKPIAPGANGRRRSSLACACVRAGGTWGVLMGAPWVEGVAQAASAAGGASRPASVRKREGPAVGRPPRSAAWVISSRSLARVGDQRRFLGGGGGAENPPPLRGGVLAGGGFERPPRRHEPLLAGQQGDE